MFLLSSLVFACCTLAQYVIPSGYTDTFQVHSPVPAPGSGSTTKAINSTVLQFSFGTRGQTTSATLTPPPDTNFTAASFTLQNYANGAQFDRLIHVAISTNGVGNFIEAWRSSTFEPTSSGVYSTYTKDMTAFISLLRSPQVVQMEIDNYVDTTYTGNFAVQLVATYYYGAKQTAVPPTAIFPATSSGGTTGSGGDGYTTVRGTGAGAGQNFDNSTVTIPRNTYKAIVQVLASGAYTGCGSTGDSDEFWWASSYGAENSFREIQVYVDGQIAGVGWPFPVLYTGGVDPSFWRPIVGINTYDAYSLPVDISPFLGGLTDGGVHTISVAVSGIPASYDCGAGWFLGGRLETWQNSSITQTTAAGFTSTVQAYAQAGTHNTNNTQSFTRHHTTSAIINGHVYNYTQALSFSNTVDIAGNVAQTTTGTDTTNDISNTYSWPITFNGTTTVVASLSELYHEFHLSSSGINTVQTARAVSSNLVGIGYGATTQSYSDATGYSRHVQARMGAVTADSNPMMKKRGAVMANPAVARRVADQISGAVLHPRALPPILQTLLAGEVGKFLNGTSDVSQTTLTKILVDVEAVKGFDVGVVPGQVRFPLRSGTRAGPVFGRRR